MALDHPVIPLLGRLMITYIFATSGIGKRFRRRAYTRARHPLRRLVFTGVAMVGLFFAKIHNLTLSILHVPSG